MVITKVERLYPAELTFSDWMGISWPFVPCSEIVELKLTSGFGEFLWIAHPDIENNDTAKTKQVHESFAINLEGT